MSQREQGGNYRFEPNREVKRYSKLQELSYKFTRNLQLAQERFVSLLTLTILEVKEQ